MENLYELTNPQKSIWLTEQYYKGTQINNIAGTLFIEEPVNFDLLKLAVNKFLEYNDGMRIKLKYDNTNLIKQYVADYTPANFIVAELNNANELKDFEQKVANEPFEIINNNLFEFNFFKFPNTTGGFVAKFHHLICDAWTMSITTNGIISIYNNLLHNKNLEINSYSYVNYIDSEKDYLTSSKFEKSKEFWDNEFNSIGTSYISSGNTTSCRAKRETYTLDKNFCTQISEFCSINKTSPYSIFMSALSIYLSKINNVDTTIIGSPVLNRGNFKEKHTTGMFISTVPFKTTINSEETYISYLTQFTKKEFSIFRNQKYPYNILLNDIRKKFNFTKNLYDIALSYQNARDNNATSDIKYHTNWIFNNTVSNNMDIHIYDMDNTGLLSISYDYKEELFDKIDVILLHKRLISIISQLLKEPKTLIKNISIISEDEKNYILNKYNNPINYKKVYTPVISDFEKQAEISSNKIAVCDKNISYTYIELNNLANSLAYIMQQNGVKKSDKICLFFENSIELIVSILATLKLGACYIPIDVNYPIDRIKYIIENSSAKLLLSNKKNIDYLKEIKDNCYIVNIEELNNISSTAFKTETISESDLAYIIYTSGSTGKPKGVGITNRSLSNYISFCKKQYVCNETTNFPLYSSIAFDLTVTSIYTPLTTGNAIYIYRNENPQLLLKNIVDDKKVHIIKLTPAHLNLLCDIDCSESIITKMILGGDALHYDTCKKITSKFLNKLHIYNEYGPTEATVGCMIYEYSNKDDKYSSIPVGIPIENVNIYLLNNDLSLTPCGILGEMYIGGICLSSGYIGLPEKTKESFIKSPFNENELLYKTGDLAKLYYNGTMEYFGRSDFQVKINGYRIEIGEIQSSLLKHTQIKDCYVVALTIKDKKILCAYYTSIDNKDISNLDSFLHNTLPAYMVPKYFIRLNNIPLTVNGKVNKALLPQPKIEKQEYVAPTNDLEKLLQDIFSNLLDTEKKIGVTSNIFDYYIDSLIMIKAQTALYSYGFDVNTQTFYEYKTIRDLANYINSNNALNNISENNYPIISEISKPIENNFSYDNILLFGATGFLGIHILYNLLENTNSDIYCLTRAKNNVSPYDRIRNKFSYYFSSEKFDSYKNRIHIVEGNILDDNFNLSEDNYNTLCKKINCVIDTAAIVKHYGNYDTFFKTNVGGTKKVIDFCKQNKIPLNYVSTMSVSGYGLVSIPKNSEFTEKDLFIGQNYKENVYVRSKFEAENLIIKECKNGLVASIYRIGNITNRFSDGMFQENAKENAFLNRLIGFISIGSIPKEMENMSFEFTPVDICANFITKLLTNQSTNLQIYHLYNNNYLAIKDLLLYLEKLGIHIQTVDLETFKQSLLASSTLYFGITNYIHNLSNTNIITLNNNLTNKTLKHFNSSWPNIDLEYITKTINYIKNNNFIGDKNETKK